MEHKLITGGEQWLPFARSRIKALRATGLQYASQQFEIDGSSVKVRIEGEHEYIDISGTLSGMLMLVYLNVKHAYTAPPPPPASSGGDREIENLKGWVFRLDKTDPLDLSKAKLEDRIETSRRSFGSVSYQPYSPEINNYGPWLTSTLGEDRIVVRAGKYGGHRGCSLGLFQDKVVRLGNSYQGVGRRSKNELFTPFNRYFDERTDHMTVWGYKGSKFTYDSTWSNIGYDQAYTRIPPTPEPLLSQTVAGYGNTYASWIIRVDDPDTGKKATVPTVVFYRASRTSDLEFTWMFNSIHSIKLASGAEPVPAPGLAPLGAEATFDFPPRAEKYTKAEMGPNVVSTSNFILKGRTAWIPYARVWDRYGVEYSRNYIAESIPISPTHSLRSFNGTTVQFQLAKYSAGAAPALVGTPLNFLSHPLMAATPKLVELMTALENYSNPIAWWDRLSPLRYQAHLGADPLGSEEYIGFGFSLIYDSDDDIDSTAGWTLVPSEV